MFRALALVAFGFALACGQAADGPSTPSMGDESQRVASDELAPAGDDVRPSSRPPREPAPEPETTWRSCETDDDCELRDSVCMPLEAGSSETYCRRRLAALGESCRASDNCELGLVCSWTGAVRDESRHCALTCLDLDCQQDERLPLVCGGGDRPAVELDARCEAE